MNRLKRPRGGAPPQNEAAARRAIRDSGEKRIGNSTSKTYHSSKNLAKLLNLLHRPIEPTDLRYREVHGRVTRQTRPSGSTPLQAPGGWG